VSLPVPPSTFAEISAPRLPVAENESSPPFMFDHEVLGRADVDARTAPG
jgi:hypothetical protein